MAGKPQKQTKKDAVSPINGQPLPRGRKFTSETAREARAKRTAKERAQKSITAAFMQYMGEIVVVEKQGDKHVELTGAQAIAKSIIKGAMKGNAEMVKISLALIGETPSAKITVESGQLADLIDGLREPCNNDLYTEATGLDGTVADESAKTD